MADYTVTFTFRDVGGKLPKATFYLTGAASQAAAESAAQALGEIIANPSPTAPALPLTLGALHRAQLLVPLDISAWSVRTSPASGAENQKGGRIHMLAGGQYPFHVTIPTFNEALKLPSGDLDMENDQIDALELALIASGWADYRFEDVTAVTKGVFTYNGVPATE